MLKKKKFLIGGLMVLLAVGYLMYTGFQSSAMYYLTVSELLAKGPSAYNTDVRVTGTVVAGSIDREPGSLLIRFTLTDQANPLTVVYRGIAPDTFKDDSDVVVEGKYSPEGVFQAKVLLAKCPSRYTAET